MNKILTGFLSCILLFTTLAPVADASSRVKRTLRNPQTNGYTTYSSYSQTPVYQTQTNQTVYYTQPTPAYPTT